MRKPYRLLSDEERAKLAKKHHEKAENARKLFEKRVAIKATDPVVELLQMKLSFSGVGYFPHPPKCKIVTNRLSYFIDRLHLRDDEVFDQTTLISKVKKLNKENEDDHYNRRANGYACDYLQYVRVPKGAKYERSETI